MTGIINGFKWLIEFIKMVFDFFMTILETFIMVFKYLATIIELAINTIFTLPSWLQSFALITIAISVAYFLIGRSAGKNDK